MIARTQVTFSIIGKQFKPSKLRAEFSEAHDPGVIGEVGRYRGVPVPYGSAEICVPDEVTDKVRYVHKRAFPLLQTMRDAGAEEFHLHFTFHYADQCAYGFSAEELKLVTELECDVSIDCLAA